MIAHLRAYYTAPALAGLRGAAARAVRAGMLDHRAECRRIPEDREWSATGEPLAFAVDGRDFPDDAFGPNRARPARRIFTDRENAGQPRRRYRWTTHYLARVRTQTRAERRWHALDHLALRQHI